MNILQVLDYSTRHCSGVPIHARRLARHLTDYGHRISVLASQHERRCATNETVDGALTVHALTVVAVNRRICGPVRSESSASQSGQP